MASTTLRKKSGYYYARFYDPDRHPARIERTLRTRDKSVARQKLAELERKISRDEFDPWEDKTPQEGTLLTEAIEAYLKARSNRRGRTLRADRSTLLLLANSLKSGIPLNYVEKRHIESFLDRDDLSDATLHTYHTRLKSFFSWCQDEGLIKSNPVAKVEKRRIGRTEKEYLTHVNSGLELTHFIDIKLTHPLG